MFAHNGLYGAWMIGCMLKLTHEGTKLGAMIASFCLVTALVQSAFVVRIL